MVTQCARIDKVPVPTVNAINSSAGEKDEILVIARDSFCIMGLGASVATSASPTNT